MAAGRSAVLVETQDGEQAQALHAELLRRKAAGELAEVAEIVPAARTVLVSGLADPEGFAADVLRRDGAAPGARAGGAAVELPGAVRRARPGGGGRAVADVSGRVSRPP